MDNCISVVTNLLAKFKIKYTRQYIEDTILSHPEYPSLQAVSDTLSNYRIESLPVKVDRQKLKEFPLPFLIQLSDGGGMFHVLVRYTEKETVYLKDNGRHKAISTEEFLKKWTGICLLLETTQYSGEPEIDKKLAEKKEIGIIKWIIGLSLLLWGFIFFSNSSLIYESNSSLKTGYILLKFVGLFMGSILLWYEVDKYNPTLQSFCSGGKKINCDSVLGSKYANAFKSKISLGLIGFSYFFGTLSFLISQGFSSGSFVPLAYLSYTSLPMVILSTYYQGRVIKKWCKFCIIIQLVLLIEAIAVFSGDFYLGEVELKSLPLLVVLLLTPILLWKWLRPLIENKKEVNLYKRGLKKLKNDPEILMGLLKKNRHITTDIENLGITIQNEKAKYNVVKVCNPYCGPCSKAHPILEELVEKHKINLQILFTATASEEDYHALPVRHFLAIDSIYNKDITLKALDDWYLSREKNYEAYAKKYPMNGELEKQNEKIMAMQKWCEAEKIEHTPTIFINGYELPREYSVEDLKEVLN